MPRRPRPGPAADAESEARRAQEEAREKVLAELNDLEAARDQLKADVSVLDKHVEAQRDRVRLATTRAPAPARRSRPRCARLPRPP